MSDDFDDTDMTEEEFDRRFAAGSAAVVVSPLFSLWTETSSPSLSRGGRSEVQTLGAPASLTVTADAGEAVLTR